MTSPRDTAFVPLTSAPVPANQRQEFHITVLSQGDKARPASSVGQPAPSPAKPHAGSCESRVSVQRDGNRITSIRVLCSCGQIIELGCLYDNAAGSH